MNIQEEQISQAGHIVRLVIDDSKEEYNVFIMNNPGRVHLGFDNAKDARKCYDMLQNLDGVNAQCRFCEQEIQEMRKGEEA
jgi:hypothetical protein